LDRDNGLYTSDILLGAFTPDGEMKWIKSIPSEKKSELFSITGLRNQLFVAGYSGGVIGSQSIAFENYLQVLTLDKSSPSDATLYAQDLAIFPNPNPGRFCLYLNEAFQVGSKIRVHNMLGQLMYEQTIESLPPAQPFLTIDLPSRIPGHYVLSLEKETQLLSLLFAVY